MSTAQFESDGPRRRAVGPRGGALAVAALLAGGCGSELDEIRAYRVPKEPPPTVSAAAMGEPTDRALPGVMAWDLPAGWSEVANPNPMRFATLQAGDGATAIEVAITQLGGGGGGIGANINRWRGQIGLPPASETELIEQSRMINATDTSGVMVDLAAPQPGDEAPRMLAAIFPADGTTWFIKTVASSALIDPHVDGFIELCESVRFTDADATEDAVASDDGDADAGVAGAPAWPSPPAGWSPDATPQAMSVMSYTIEDEGGEANLTITPLGGRQDVLANINRWRRQLGVGPIVDLAEQDPQMIEVGGASATLVDIAGATQRTLGVIDTRGGTTWFYKLTGPDALVAAQRSAFESFVGSVRFEGDQNDDE